MMKRLLLALLAMFSFYKAEAQNSQVYGTVNANLASINVLNTNNPLANTTYLLNLQPYFGYTFPQATNGVGIGYANCFYSTNITLTNGALVGTNWLNVHTFSGTDLVGNTFSMTQAKVVIIRNLGAATSYGAYETNIFQVQNPGTTAAWTNFLGATNVGLTLQGPTTNQANTAVWNYTTEIFLSPGDSGYTVGTSTDNTIVLTNPVVSSTPVTAQLIFIGSSGL